jgi:hypothetical protein
MMSRGILPTALRATFSSRDGASYEQAARRLAWVALDDGLTLASVGRDAVAVDDTRYRIVLHEAGDDLEAGLELDLRTFLPQGELDATKVARDWTAQSPGAQREDVRGDRSSSLVPVAGQRTASRAIGGVGLGNPVAESPDHQSHGSTYRWYDLDNAVRIWRVSTGGWVDLYVRRAGSGGRASWDHWSLPRPGGSSPLRRTYLRLRASGWSMLDTVDPGTVATRPAGWRDRPRTHVGHTVSPEAVRLLLPPTMSTTTLIAEIKDRCLGPTAFRVLPGHEIRGTVRGLVVSVRARAVVDLFHERIRATVDDEGRATFVLVG